MHCGQAFVFLLLLFLVVHSLSGGELSGKSRGIVASEPATENLIPRRFKNLD